jgi:hypothetical protein
MNSRRSDRGEGPAIAGVQTTLARVEDVALALYQNKSAGKHFDSSRGHGVAIHL